MFKLRNLKIGPRLAVGFGSLVLFLTIVVAISLVGFNVVEQRNDSIVNREWKAAERAADMVRLINENARITTQMALSTDSDTIASLADKVLTNRKEVDKASADLEAAIYTDQGRELLAKMKEARLPYQASFAKMNKLLGEKKRDDAMQVLLNERIPALNNFVDKIQALADYQTQLVNKAGAETKNTIATNRNIMIGAGLLALLLGGLLALLTARHITRATSRLQSTVKRVAQGDYEARARLNTGDELGELASAFDTMLNERVASLAQKERENEALNNSIIDILRSVAKLAKGDLTVKAPVREDITGALSDAINSMADSTAKTLAGVNQVSHEVRSASQTGRDTVLVTARGMNEIRGTIQETGKRIKRLGERSQEITGIVKLIDDIAERTSVLALNANMQAAMAGEAGRGFRVVADEVQRLAERSKEATDQIAKLVNTIQGETGETMATMDRAIGEVVKGGELAEKAAEQVTHLDELGGELLASVQAFKLPEDLVQAGAPGTAGENRRAA